MAEDYSRQAEQWQRRHAATKMGKNSVSYNPITLEYHRDDAGLKLAHEDAKTLVSGEYTLSLFLVSGLFY